MNASQPLITVAVMTYESGLYVIETLESIYKQTYQNIELLVSDDCSKDNTIELINQWISEEKNKQRFRRIELLTVPRNTGVSANCNRVIAAASTDWIKFIAGDDILLPNCIADNANFILECPGANIIFSQVRVYQDTFKNEHYVRTTPEEYPKNLMDPAFTAADQFQLLLISDRIHYTPSYFFNKQALLKVGNYDEVNAIVEDYPMWLKLTQSGERLFYFHKETVGYRIHSKAINNVGDSVLFKPAVINNFAARKAFAHAFLPWEIVKSEQHVYRVSKFFQNQGWNKKTNLYRKMYHVASFYLNPYHYIYAFKKRLPGNKKNPFYS